MDRHPPHVWPPGALQWPAWPLEDGHVAIDRMSEADVDALVSAIDDEIVRWLPIGAPYDVAAALRYLEWQTEVAERGEALVFAVRPANNGRPLVGSASLHFRAGPGVVEAGYWVSPGSRQRGVATRALRLVAGHAFRTWPLRRVEMLVRVDNVASRRTCERAGATFEGVRRHGIQEDSRCFDAAVYSFLPADLDLEASSPHDQVNARQ